MEFTDLIRARYSVRAYKADAIAKDVLARVLEAAILAPTAANRQPFRLIVAHTADRHSELRKVYKQPWFTAAPLVICICAVPDEAWMRRDQVSYATVDATIAMDHLILAAANEGLGTCWIGAFDPVAAREVFDLPQDVEPVALTPLGWPDDAPGPKRRRPLEELVKYERW